MLLKIMTNNTEINYLKVWFVKIVHIWDVYTGENMPWIK